MTYFINKKIINNSFTEAYNSEFFVDKSEIIEKLNKQINKIGKYLCITRPRRFGKTINAMMLETYYSKNANSKEIFDKLNISKCDSYEKHLNKHNVIYITFNNNASSCKTYDEYMNFYIDGLKKDIKELWPDINTNLTIPVLLDEIYSKTSEGFIFIIDEWDYIFSRQLFTEQERDNYVEFLRDLLKDKPYVELCYMTGVLPISKYSIGSSLNMFEECSFLNDGEYYSYYGFTTEEVENLCKKQDKLSMQDLKEWYDGYKIRGIDLYNPRSVYYALKNGNARVIGLTQDL